MSYIKILVHCVWTTKDRIPYLRNEIRDKVILHIRDNALKKGIYIDHISGYIQHLHALISLGGKQNVSDVMQFIKGESSYWINKNKLTRTRFEWQDDFYSVSIGIPQIENVRRYIRNQVGHHAAVSLDDELKEIFPELQLQKKLD